MLKSGVPDVPACVLGLGERGKKLSDKAIGCVFSVQEGSAYWPVNPEKISLREGCWNDTRYESINVACCALPPPACRDARRALAE
jgi:hypothetical protein